MLPDPAIIIVLYGRAFSLSKPKATYFEYDKSAGKMSNITSILCSVTTSVNCSLIEQDFSTVFVQYMEVVTPLNVKLPPT
jgi:hypothetical protein